MCTKKWKKNLIEKSVVEEEDPKCLVVDMSKTKPARLLRKIFGVWNEEGNGRRGRNE